MKLPKDAAVISFRDYFSSIGSLASGEAMKGEANHQVWLHVLTVKMISSSDPTKLATSGGSAEEAEYAESQTPLH